MGAQRRPTTRMLAPFLLLLAGQLYAYPSQMPLSGSGEDPSPSLQQLMSDFGEDSDRIAQHLPSHLGENSEDDVYRRHRQYILKPYPSRENSLDYIDSTNDVRSLRHELQVQRAIRIGMDEGDITDKKSRWIGTPKDTSQQEGTHATSRSLTTRAINNPQGYQEQPSNSSEQGETHAPTISLKTRAIDSPQGQRGQQGQRRLFGEQNAPSATGSVHSDGKIVFPMDDGDQHKFSPRPPPVCQGATFCERAAFYPENLINQAMQLNDTLRFLAGVDVVSEIEQRIDVLEEAPLCQSVEQVVYPKSAENKRKEWLFVVNQDNFKQGIRIETCRNEDNECSLVDGLAEGYRTVCKQKYIYRQLAAISNDGTVAPDMFRFPSSCCCHAKFTGNPLTRSGLIGSPSQAPAPKIRRRK